MDRRKFLKLAAVLPMILLGRHASASPGLTAAPNKEIVLLETFVAGWQYHQGDSIWNALQPDDALSLCREPQNPYDESAIAVYACGVKIGYVPRIHNTVIAGMIDQNALVKAHVLKKHKTPHPWEKMEIKVTMATG